MSEQPRKRGREGKVAVQMFFTPAAHKRIKAACALAGEDVSEQMERLGLDFADHMGIPAEPPAKPPKPKR